VRTLLTYVLAAAFAGLLVTVIVSGRSQVELFSGIVDGRYRVVAALNPVIEFSTRALGYLAVLGSSTLLSARFFDAQRTFGSLRRALPAGVILAAIGFMVVWAAYSLISSGPAIAMLATTSFWLELVVAGAAWGTVFWMRAAKPTTAGAAA
jgi:hypothetical protein